MLTAAQRYVYSTIFSFIMHISIVAVFLFEMQFIVIDHLKDHQKEFDSNILFEDLVFEHIDSYSAVMKNVNTLASTIKESDDEEINYKDVPLLNSQTDISYKKIVTAHIASIIKKMVNKDLGNFKVDLLITIGADGSIISYKVLPEPTDLKLKSFFNSVIIAANPAPIPPLEFLKSEKAIFLIKLHNT